MRSGATPSLRAAAGRAGLPNGDAGGAVTDIAVAVSADGGLDLCAVLQDNTVAYCRQDDLGGPWTDWTSVSALTAGPVAGPALVRDSESCLTTQKPPSELLTYQRALEWTP